MLSSTAPVSTGSATVLTTSNTVVSTIEWWMAAFVRNRKNLCAPAG
jgi:hypothetical protein